MVGFVGSWWYLGVFMVLGLGDIGVWFRFGRRVWVFVVLFWVWVWLMLLGLLLAGWGRFRFMILGFRLIW